jgi:hypothetical protein
MLSNRMGRIALLMYVKSTSNPNTTTIRAKVSPVNNAG